jgi:hypothetical protein
MQLNTKANCQLLIASCFLAFVAPAGVPDHARCSRGGVGALLPVKI